eukprot:Pgem_evm1s14664
MANVKEHLGKLEGLLDTFISKLELVFNLVEYPEVHCKNCDEVVNLNINSENEPEEKEYLQAQPTEYTSVFTQTDE